MIATYTAEALADARHILERHLSGQVTLSGARAEVRRAANGDRPILRRPAERPAWRPTREWPMTIEDVLTGDETAYFHRVVTCAESVIRTLDADDATSR